MSNSGKISTYEVRVKEHLMRYKKQHLKITEDGVYRYKGKNIVYKYILPKDKKEFNIIDKYRKSFYNSEYSNIKYHMYFNHLNSSQAMCINFFYPLIKENKIDILLDILGINNGTDKGFKEIAFEKESDIENKLQRKTNFDFYIELNSGIKVYFEIKYTENEFGKAKNDLSHKNKFSKTYKSLLENNIAIKEEYKSEQVFLNDYQIMRNIIHIDEKSYIVFLYPDGNEKIKNKAVEVKNNVIKAELQKQCILLTWEELLNQIQINVNDISLANYYKDEFAYKYIV